MMTALQVTILVLVAAGATAVVLIRDPVRQVVSLSIYGLLLPCCSWRSRPRM